MSHDDDDEVYDFTTKLFDDVAGFKGPRATDGTRDLHYRIYDADTETVAYATRVGRQSDGEIALVVRDATGTDIAS